MLTLTWGQVNTWRLSQQGLRQRLPADNLIQAVRQLLGIHAQVMSAAEMAIGARVDGLSPQDVQSALWQQRTLVKTWMMRQTLHLVPSDDFPIYIAARQITDINWLEFFKRNGINIDRKIFDAYLSVAPEILSNEPLTRQQFAQAVVERLKSPELGAILASPSWGMPFKPLAWHGELAFGPGNGQNATFVRPSAWMGEWQTPDPEAAFQEILRRFLTVYGPARPHFFQWWWWTSSSAVKKALNSIADETEEVDVEGWHATAMKATIPSILEMIPNGEVYLLPAFDVFTVGSPRGRDLERLISLDRQKKVYRPQGWVSAVVMENGFIKGTWDYKVTHSKLSITVNVFSNHSDGSKEAIAIEAERYGKFLNLPVSLEFNQD